MPTAAPTDLNAAHRWFAVELNNLAWGLIEAPARTADEVDTLIHAAHASVYHWMQVGDAVHRLRGLCLLATAHAAANDAPNALRYARQCVELSSQDPSGQTDFDRATAHGCFARALALNGDKTASAAYADALTSAGMLDDDDREVFNQLYPRP